MKFERASGILLHPTSLPSADGIGDLGPQAHRWLEFLAGAGCGLWQILPLRPTGYGDSPYQCFSAFAGNPLLISLDMLVEDGLLQQPELVDRLQFPAGTVDYGRVIAWKSTMLDRAYANLEHSASPELLAEFENFIHQQAYWLDDFTLFMALKESFQGRSWISWPQMLRDRQPGALQPARQEHDRNIRRQAFRQFIFFRQWDELRAKASKLGIKIIGDAPLFIAHDSADVWANRELFYLEENGAAAYVAGVPPDYFSSTGQLWGNPLYRWQAHKASNYSWWQQRLRSEVAMVDIVRLDHFRGFAGYWRISGKAKTAEKGRWVRGPGRDFFRVMRATFGELPFIAEDLGVITPDVVQLRDEFGFPGMKIVQFSFGGGPDNPFLPHNHTQHCVVYTGSHDNDTAWGWYETAPEPERDFYRRYLDRDGENAAWDLIRATWASVAVMAVAPMQDFLELGSEARMNYPSKPIGNWSWRLPEDALSPDLQKRIRELNYLYDREANSRAVDTG